METRKRRVDIDYFEPLNGNVKKPKVSIGTLSKTKPDKCSTCRQLLEEVVYYNGHANNSNEEFISLTNEKLSLFTGDEETIHESDELPTHKITNYSVYDKNGHLCPFDTGLIEKNVILHMSGYLKPIYDDNPSLDGGVPTHDIGPINEWYISGFDGGENAVVGVLTPYATYVLMDASEEYSPFVKMLRKKAMLVKTVTEYLLDHVLDDPTYEDLLFHIQSQGNENLSEDFLLQHAQFICDQIYILDQAVEDEKQMITAPCMRTLVQMSGVTFRRRKQLVRDQNMQEKKLDFTKATTTEMVRSIFENFFPDQIDGKETKGPKKKRCGVCDACQSPDCGKCSNCKDMPKFGGGGKGKQACKNRKCPNMAIQDAEESENENESDDDDNDKSITLKKCAVQIVNPVKWPKEPICEQKGKKYYYSTIVGDMLIKLGEFVMLAPNTPEEPCYVAKVINMYNTITVKGSTNMLHYQLFCRGIDTILGATSDPQELFVTDECDGCDLGCVVRKAQVTHRKVPENWSELGGTEALPAQLDDDGQTFFFNKKYTPQTGTFSDYVPEEITEDFIHSCFCCRKKIDEKQLSKPTLCDGGVQFHGEVYRVGSAVFLDPTVYDFSPYQSDTTSESGKPSVDHAVFTEFYRKTDDTKGSNLDTPEPFCIALIEEIKESKNGDIVIHVRLFYRPENTRNSVFLAFQNDLNQVYWSDLTLSTAFTKVRGKCYLMYFGEDDLDRQWCDEGPYRFYFSQAYDPRTYEYTEVPVSGRKIGCKGKGKGVGKGKSAKSAHHDLEAQDWEKISRPLKCMDVFAGCGGLSLGLHQTGICETKWAIEKDAAAAQAFKLNNRDCKVFTDDCNDILQQVISGKGEVKGLPSKGEVEMLIGGPPCQGFSGMNRFNAGQYSLFKNSLVVSYLSFCEYYRPKYFVLENVRNFVSFKRSMVLKLALRCLTAIGYQVRFGVLQAGHYGVPQTRRRLILIAAAPGCVLPKLPEPQHVFNRRGCHLSFALDGNRYSNGNFWTESAPYRTICVRDAISDLPEIPNGWSKAEIECEEEATSHFQRRLHKVDNSMLYDHICKEMAPLVVARISYIPIIPGSDWRDLPNAIVTLSDGKQTQKLKYNYRSIKQKQIDGPNRAVCRCAIGEHCDPSDRQVNTLIPWCLPHTGDRHNHWAGLYGRLEWDGFFGTTITNPEPMGKQGRVLHPEQHRVVSVRECARSQGFPDHFKFHGSIMDKHRQVGNAVPPPLGEAIGIEIRKALVQCKFD